VRLRGRLSNFPVLPLFVTFGPPASLAQIMQITHSLMALRKRHFPLFLLSQARQSACWLLWARGEDRITSDRERVRAAREEGGHPSVRRRFRLGGVVAVEPVLHALRPAGASAQREQQ
jgi:hypothetical protein